MKKNSLAILLAAALLPIAGFVFAETQLPANTKAPIKEPVLEVAEKGKPTAGDYIDLHMHTYCSDGWSVPEQLVKLAAGDAKFYGSGEKGPRIKYFAVTDHDTMDCVARAQTFAKKNYPEITVIAGIEITANDNTHILGLNVNTGAAGVQDIATNSRRDRVARMQEYIKKLNKMGAAITVRDVVMPKLIGENLANGKSTETISGMTDKEMLEAVSGMMMRPDIAKALIAKGYAANNRDAFDKWITPAKVPGESLPFKKVIDAIHAAGGKAILAHPYTIYKYGEFPQEYGDESYNDFESIVAAMLEAGLDGFEAYKNGWQKYPADYNKLKAIADKWKAKTGKEVFFTVGSDYHGVTGIGPKSMMSEKIPVGAQQAIISALNLN